MPVEKICEWCRKPYSVWPKLSTRQRFCSRSCFIRYRYSVDPRWNFPVGRKKSGIPRQAKMYVCSNCKKEIYKSPYVIGRHKNLFCSVNCQRSYTTGKNHQAFRDNSRAEFTCDWCGEPFIRYLSRLKKSKFCSLDCYHKSLVIEGALRPGRGRNWQEQRQKALVRDNWTCQDCGATIDEIGERSIHVHHKIPYREFGNYREANDLKNLITLCASCHPRIEHIYLTSATVTE